MAQVLLLVTLTTKRQEANFLLEKLSAAGVSARVIDTSLDTGGALLDGDAKCVAMDQAADKALKEVVAYIQSGSEVVLGIGGGTGGEIILQVMRSLPITFPKILVTTLPFDPRFAVADNSIVVVPTLADVAGLNAMLRDVLENAALMTSGLCNKTRKGELTELVPAIGITALGATEGAIRPLIRLCASQKRETAVFHANGFGGAAFARFAAHGAFNAIIDLTPHELTRLHVAGVHAPMPHRFTAGGDLPRVVLPGGLNFIGLGQKSLVPDQFLRRPHYEHSGLFTHVQVTKDEMQLVSTKLAEALNKLSGPVSVIMPMGGFSHHDRPGGAIDAPYLRDVCLETLQSQLSEHIQINVVKDHISDPNIAGLIMTTLDSFELPKEAIC